MAITSVNEIWPGRQASDDFTRHRLYTRVYEVYCDDPDDGPGVAGFTMALPRLGDSHPEDSQAVCVLVNPVQDEADPLRWVVNIEYDTQPEFPDAVQPDLTEGGGGEGTTQDIGDRPDSPLDRPPVWKFSFEKTTEIAKSGFKVDPDDGSLSVLPKAIATSAGMPFDPPATIEVSRPIVSVTVNVAQVSLWHLADIQDTINEFDWNGCAPRQAKCVGAEASSGFENGVFFWSVTYTFAIRYETWDVQLLDAGFHKIRHDSYLDADRVVAITDDIGGQSGPWMLNGAGDLLPAGDPPKYLRWVVYRMKNFAAVFPI
jgi:hypothetical protein